MIQINANRSALLSAHSYLFLKEKIHYQHDLAACQEEIATYIFSRVDQEVRKNM